MTMPKMLFLVLVWFTLLSQASSQPAPCGSLMTYRQYSVILSSAPTCFQDGCGAPPPATSMSSTCAVSQPCSHLWEHMRLKWQDEWCASCQDDIACRIPGWPILNMTATCAAQPNEWLFSNIGGCCIADQEPFHLADWIGGLCNGSDWRQPFEYYGYMAKEDWEEWVEPWNWTVRPENASGEPIQQVSCSDPSTTLWTFGIENLVQAVEFVAETGIFLVVVNLGFTRAFLRHFRMPINITLFAAIRSGISFPLVHWIVSSFVIAATWRASAGYQNVPVGFLGLLLCARPNALMILTCVLLLIDRRIRVDYPLTSLSPYLQLSPDIQQFGRIRAKQLVSNLGLSVSITEFIIQALGYYSYFKTADTGVKRGFYVAGRLIPYLHGSKAMRMYAGAITHAILAFPTAFLLYVSAYIHAQDNKFHTFMFKLFARVMSPLDEHFHVINQEEQQESRRSRRSRRRRRRRRRRRQQQQQQQTQEEEEPAGDNEKLHVGWVTSTLTFFGWDSSRRRTAATPPLETEPMSSQGAPAPIASTTAENGSQSDEVVQQQQDADDEEAEEEEIVVYWYESVVLYFFVWLERGVPDDVTNRYPSLRQAAETEFPPEQVDPDFAWGVLWLTTFFAVVNFIAQWCFWSGFVQSQGPRFCPPDENKIVLRVRLLLTLLPLVGITPNFFFSAVDSASGN